jgi:hypothetical protein
MHLLYDDQSALADFEWKNDFVAAPGRLYANIGWL